MTGKQMIKKYEQNGWKVANTEGSHYKMKKNDQTEIIPHHTKELRKGLQEYLLKRLREVK